MNKGMRDHTLRKGTHARRNQHRRIAEEGSKLTMSVHEKKRDDEASEDKHEASGELDHQM